MIDALTDPFELDLARRALVEVVLLGLACGPLGVWIVLYRQSYAAESIAHAALPGMVVATLAGLPIALGAAGGVLVAALAIAAATRAPAVGPDTAIAVVVTSLIGVGALLALSPEVPARLGELLFGDPLAVSGGDLVVAGVVCVGVLVALGVTGRSLTVAAFEPVSAASLGAAPARARATLLVVIAATTLAAVEALGNLLVVALLIAPGAAALRLTRRLGAALALAAALAIAAGVGGLYLSFYAELAAGAAIALVALAVFAGSLLWRRDAPRRRTGAPLEILGDTG